MVQISRQTTALIPLQNEQLFRFGKIALARASWGRALTTADLLPLYAERNQADTLATMEHTGFTQGYYLPFDQELLSDTTQTLHAQAIVTLTERVMQARDWRDVDVLVIGSTTTRLAVLDEVKRLLQARGLAVGMLKMVLQACNSAVAGITDLCRDTTYHGQRAVVVGLETLSASVSDIETPATLRIFGNGGAAIAFIPGVEIQHLVGRTIVEHDRNGVLSLPQACPLPSLSSAHLPIPAWYEFADEATRDKLVATAEGIFMTMPPSPDGHLHMNSLATMTYFGKRVPPVMLDVLNTYRTQLQGEFGELGPAICHQPSQPVVEFLNHELARTELEMLGIASQVARRLVHRPASEIYAQLATLDINHFAPLQLPWVMTDTGFNNIGAATPLIALSALIEHNLITPTSVVPAIGFGIGSVIQADVWQFAG